MQPCDGAKKAKGVAIDAAQSAAFPGAGSWNTHLVDWRRTGNGICKRGMMVVGRIYPKQSHSSGARLHSASHLQPGEGKGTLKQMRKREKEAGKGVRMEMRMRMRMRVRVKR